MPPTPILGVLLDLPMKGESWTKKERDDFLNLFESVLDYCYSMKEEEDA